MSNEKRTALLVLVHGSPRPTANNDMYRVVELCKEKGIYPIVEVGFLECNEPLIPDAIDRCASQGAEAIVAVPYFLHTGTHVSQDLPELLAEGKQRHPQIEFRLGPFLGRSAKVTDILTDRTIAALDPYRSAED
jgi:sirohydrochlorin ferrochelatase